MTLAGSPWALTNAPEQVVSVVQEAPLTDIAIVRLAGPRLGADR